MAKGITFRAARVPEQIQELGNLALGATFRFPGKSFEDVTGGEEAGGNFYRVLKLKNNDGAVEVISWDFKVTRKLPYETAVIEHSASVDFISNRDAEIS
jgi:non-canonical (house-cleaning) NTP pyrophosphatase